MFSPMFTNTRSAAVDTFNDLRRQAAPLWPVSFHRNRYLDDFSALSSCSLADRRYLGLQDIRVDQITGSVSRTRDFDRSFRPTGKHLVDRWVNVYLLFQRGDWPPIRVYKAGDHYFVEDGHHRVSVAHFEGVEFIRAEVWEYTFKHCDILF